MNAIIALIKQYGAMIVANNGLVIFNPSSVDEDELSTLVKAEGLSYSLTTVKSFDTKKGVWREPMLWVGKNKKVATDEQALSALSKL